MYARSLSVSVSGEKVIKHASMHVRTWSFGLLPGFVLQCIVGSWTGIKVDMEYLFVGMLLCVVLSLPTTRGISYTLIQH